MNEDKCKYCFHNTAGISCNGDPATCESYEYNHLAEKYENKRYQVKWEDGNDVRVLMTDKLDEFPEWYFETVEDAEQLADHLNKKEELIQDIEDDYVDSILDLLDKNLKLKSKQEGLLMGDTYMNKINVLLELLEDTGKEHLVVEFMDKIHDTNPYLINNSEFWPTKEEVAEIRKKYPEGTKIEVIKMDDPIPVPPGTIGIVTTVDDIGNIHCRYLNYRSGLAIVPSKDKFKVIK